MAYINGNLALQPKKRPDEKREVREQKRVVIRRKSLPAQEKLLYLFTILVCVVVAGVIIFRQAHIYQMNLEIREITRQHDALVYNVRELEKKVEQLSDPEVIKQKALEAGMVEAEHPPLTLRLEDRPLQTVLNE